MRWRVWALGFATVFGGCMSTKPDYVAETRPLACDIGSRLARQGWPDNLDRVLVDNCTVMRTDQTRGTDFTVWFANASSPIMDCASPIPIPFWTEKSEDGKIAVVHLCPDFCMELKKRLIDALKNDVGCTDPPVGAGSGGTTMQPPAAGAAGGAGALATAGSTAPQAGSGGSF